MTFNLAEVPSRLDDIAAQYEREGFILLTGVEDQIAARFRAMLARTIGVGEEQFGEMIDPATSAPVFDREVRRRLARVPTSDELTANLLEVLGPLLGRLLGPLVHISSTYHAQFKGGLAREVSRGGYAADSDYMEVHGPYLLHQDFAGATIPTSPSALTVWVAVNSCPDWNLRVYPGSHRHGLLCNRWVPLEDSRLADFGPPLDIPARAGTAVLFNAMLLHGTSNAGPLRRVSCDIRFFPLCGYLPTRVHRLDGMANVSLRGSLERQSGPVLQAPRLEGLAFLGRYTQAAAVPPHSVLNWANYIAQTVAGDPDHALLSLRRFVNETRGFDPAEPYIAKFHGHPLHQPTLETAHRLIPPPEKAGARNDQAHR